MTTKSSNTKASSVIQAGSPEIYSATMDTQRQTSLNILKAFEKSFAETSNGAITSSDKQHGVQFLDVGCGPGNFTFNTLLPRYLGQCHRIVGVDNNPAMIGFANLHHKNENVIYEVLDIVDGDMESFVREHGLFARVFSFNMLHWVKDRTRALKNIEKLMAPGGECFVFFHHSMPILEVIIALIESKQWKKYAKVLEDSLPATARSTDFYAMRQHLQDLLNGTDLKPLAWEVVRLPRVHPDLDDTTARLVSFNPIYSLLDDKEKEELFKFTANFLADQAQAVRDGRTLNQLFAYVIHAYKPAP